MKNIINRKNLLLAVTLLLAPAAQGQEYIKEVVDVSSDYSIIREYKEDTRVIYSSSADGKQFLMVTESGTTTTLMDLLDEIYVSDFEIMEDTLYFCGSCYFNRMYGCIGFINLNAFPNNLHVKRFPQMSVFSKMEIFKSRYGGEKHIAMIGSMNDEGGVLVDMNLMTGNIRYTTTDSLWDVFDDVAATDSRIIASVRSYTKHGYIYNYNHPAVGNSFLISPSFTTLIGGNILSPIILEGCESDYFISACRRIVDDEEHDYVIDILACHGGVFHRRRYFDSSQDNYIPFDLKYNYFKKGADLLVLKMPNRTNHVIYHFNSDTVFGAHSIIKSDVYSIDYLKYKPNHFIASGKDVEKGCLRYIKYSPVYRGNCTYFHIPDHSDIKEQLVLKPLTSRCKILDAEGVLINRRAGEKNVELRCYYDMKKDLE